MRRDFTYIDDVVEGVVRVLGRPPAAVEGPPYAIYNIGNHTAVELETFIATLEGLLGRAAIKHYAPMQAGDVPATYAAIDRLAAATGFAPHTPLAEDWPASWPGIAGTTISGGLAGRRAVPARRCRMLELSAVSTPARPARSRRPSPRSSEPAGRAPATAARLLVRPPPTQPTPKPP